MNASSSRMKGVDRIPDAGIVINDMVRASFRGIGYLALEAYGVIASVETFLKYVKKQSGSLYEPGMLMR